MSTAVYESVPASRGTTIIETLMAMTVIAIALMALLSSVICSMTMVEMNRQEAAVLSVARRKIAELQARTKVRADFESIFKWYGPNAVAIDGVCAAANDPGAAAEAETDTLARHTFWVPGVLPAQGTIEFPTAGNPAKLTETLVDSEWGMPRDLEGVDPGNLNPGANATNNDVSTTAGNPLCYKLLPVRVVIRWDTIHGPRVSRYASILCNY